MTVETGTQRGSPARPRKEALIDFAMQMANFGVILAFSFAVGAVVIVLSGKDPIAAYRALFVGAFGSLTTFADTLDRSTILILAGLAAVVAFGTNVINLGIEGQLYMGAFAAAWVGFSVVGVPSPVHIALALLAAALAGALFSLPAILLKIRWNVDEIVTTLMLNYIATFFTAYLVAFPFRAPSAILAGTEAIAPTAVLPRLLRGSVLNVGFIIALVLVFCVYWLLFRTKQGYELRMVGLSRRFASYAGMSVNRSALWGMLISGALAGVGGGAIILGFFKRFITGFSQGYGWDGIVICLLATQNPITVIPAAIFYAALANGGLNMQSATQVPSMVVVVVKGVIMFIVTVQAFARFRRARV